LPAGFSRKAGNLVPELSFKFFVTAFIDNDQYRGKSEGDYGKSFWVWTREGYAGMFTSSPNYDPRVVLDERYSLTQAKDRATAHNLELTLNYAESADIGNKIRVELEGAEDMTSAELSDLLDVKCGRVSQEARRLASAKIIKKNRSRVCTTVVSDRKVTAWATV